MIAENHIEQDAISCYNKSDDINDEQDIHHCKCDGSDKKQLCMILDQFCETLIDFAICVKEPTLNMKNRIKDKKKRTRRFDDYILTIEEFNIIMDEVLEMLGNVILALKLLLMDKSLTRLQNFINSLVQFLALLKENNVFNRLNEAKLHLDVMHEKDIKTAELLQKINTIVYKVCSIGLEVTSLVIPGLGIAKEVAGILNEQIDKNITQTVETLHHTQVQLDRVIETLIDIRKQSSDLTIVLNVNTDKIIKCLYDKNAHDLKIISRNLEVEYIHLAHLILNTQSEINIYKNKKQNILSAIFHPLRL